MELRDQMSYEHTRIPRQQKASGNSFDAGQSRRQHELLLQARSRAGLTAIWLLSPLPLGQLESLATKSLLRDESGDAPSDGKDGLVPNDVARGLARLWITSEQGP